MLGIKPGVRSPNATSVLCRPPNQTQTLINCQLPGQNGPWHQVASTKLPVAIVLVFSQLAPVVKVPNAPVWIYLYKKNLAEFWQIILPCLACIGCTKDVIDKLQASCLMAKYGVGGGGGKKRKKKRGVVSGLFTTVATCQTERRQEWFPGIAHKKGGRKTIGYKA